MVNTLTLVLVGIVAYWLAATWLKNEGYLPEAISIQGPITTIHTKRGRAFIDRLARPRRFWRAWSNVGVGAALVVMVGSFVVLVLSTVSILQNPEQTATAVNQPKNVLVIPGVNDFLPLSAAPGIVFGLLVGLVVHEGGHGLLCRVEDIEIESMGLALFTILPVGAFVEPNDAERREASRGGQTRMFAAGVTNNFAVTFVAFALLFGPVIASIGVAPGVAVQGVLPGSAAATAGIASGDRITAIGGQQVHNDSELTAVLAGTNDSSVRVELNDGKRTVTVDRSVLVTANVSGAPGAVPIGAKITAVNGTPVDTRAGFHDRLRASPGVVQVTYERTVDGRTTTGETTLPAGAYVRVVPDGPFERSGATGDASLVVTQIAGQRVVSYEDLGTVMDGLSPGQSVDVVAYDCANGCQRRQYTVELGESGGGALLGVQRLAPGTTGVTVSDFGIRSYPADRYLAALGGTSANSPIKWFLRSAIIALFLPFASLSIGDLPYNFAGFTPDIANFYAVQGPLGIFGEGVIFLLANLLFWTGWINVQLGFLNCIPAYPLDGGHILRTSTETILSRLPVRTTRRTVRVVTTTVGLSMLASILLLLFGPQLL